MPPKNATGHDAQSRRQHWGPSRHHHFGFVERQIQAPRSPQILQGSLNGPLCHRSVRPNQNEVVNV